jgi:hypothetical protein
MTRRPDFASAVRRFALGFALAGGLAGLALSGAPSQAFEPQPGSKNFTPPSFVPNYFSDEAALFGRASQTAQPAGDRFNTAPVAASGGYAVTSEPSRNTTASAGRARYRGKLAHGRTGRVKSASSRTVRAHAGGASVHRANVHGASVHGAHSRGPRGRSAHSHSSTTAASRHSVTTTGRAAAGRTSRSAGRTGQVRQASR